ncbi:hypothetical protein N7466_006870 [Penicillium verhagenii]|uniref:uncharacterized protein n=1 Tax=Penicillium verhagenii TaxID=1562060 RepID=UPI00254508DD|nr:uncharacterized protein N7466_006870 [Penicillium verhagenii]KAJ5927914.1 hypothetical protein N7466_006870 [Penicillium verhagenii]
MVDRIFLPPIFDVMIDNALRDGSHEALHSIVSIEKLGAMGPAGMELMSWTWTKAKSAAAKKAYAPNHHSDYVGMLHTPAGTSNMGARGIMDNLCSGCIHCFRFLVGKDIISTTGFDDLGQGYMYVASFLDYRDIVNFLATKIPLEWVFYPQDRLRTTQTPFSISLKSEESMWIMLDRIAELPSQQHPGYRLRRWIEDVQLVQMASWMNPEAAYKLLSWGINFGSGTDALLGTVWTSLITTKNPHRVAMLEWLDDNSSPFLIGAPIVPLINQTVYNNPSERRFHELPPGHWPPWGVAMAMGDKESAFTLAALPRTNRLMRCGLGSDSMYRHQELGYAAIYNVKEEHIELLDDWLEKASTDLELLDRFHGVTHMIEDLLYRVLYFRSQIWRKWPRWVCSGERPTLPLPTSLLQKKRKETSHKIDVAFRMIHLILRKAFPGSANQGQRVPYFDGIMSDPRQREKKRRIVKDSERVALWNVLRDGTCVMKRVA